jgi:hypothetical protein
MDVHIQEVVAALRHRGHQLLVVGPVCCEGIVLDVKYSDALGVLSSLEEF